MSVVPLSAQAKTFSQKLFDQTFYLNNNLDVLTAVSQGLTTAFAHFSTFGHRENRPLLPFFNTQAYLTANPDVANAVAQPGWVSAWNHFVLFGILEGRSPNGTAGFTGLFDNAKYLAQNPDVNAAVSNNAFRNGFEHYLLFGSKEGRAAFDKAGNEIDLSGAVTPGQTFTLTNGADAFTGTKGNDTFVATEATLSSADVIDGGLGNDLFRYASSGLGPITEAGFEIKNVETIQITSDATGGTTFDVTAVEGLKTIRNFQSGQDLTITGLKSLAPTIEIVALGSTGAPDTTVVFDAAAKAGTTDTVALNVRANLTTAGNAVGTVTVNGIETFNIKSSVSASAFAGIASDTLREMNITGDANLRINSANFNNTAAVNIVNAQDFTGNLNITLTNSGAANIDVEVTGGKGNDRVDFSNGFDKNDAFDGGVGNDTLALTNNVAVVVNPADFGTVKNVEILEITDGGGDVGADKLDLDNFAGVTTVYYSNSLAGGTTVQDVVSGLTIKVNNPSGQNLTTTLMTDGSADVLSLQVEKLATAGENAGVVTAAKFETVNLDVRDDATDPGVGKLTITQLAINAATTLNITGNAHLTIANDGNPATPALATLNAKDMSGKITLTGVDFAKAGATITFGSGDDTFNVATADGADTITLGAGKDLVRYTAVGQSNTKMDVITDFVSGTDRLDLSYTDATGATAIDWSANAGVQSFVSSDQFVGNRPTFAQAQGALTAGGKVSVVFQQDEQILWLDANGDGTLDNNDFRVQLKGVTAITAADLGFTAGNAITLTAPAANVNLTTKTNATNVTTNNDDTITTSIANLAGSAVDGAGGTDTLVMSDAGVVAPGAGVVNVEALTLANGTNTVNLNAAGAFRTITGGTGKDTVNLTNLVAGGAVNLGAGDDTLTNATEAIIEGAGSSFVGGDGDDTLTFLGGITAANLELTSVSGFETIDLGAVGGNVTVTKFTSDTAVRTLIGDTTSANITVQMSAAQLDALTTITSAVASNIFKINITDTGSVTVNLADTTYTTLANVDEISFASVTAGNVAKVTIDELLKVTGGLGANDELTVSADLGAGANLQNIVGFAVTKFEILNVTAAQTGLTVHNDAVTINANAGGIYTLGTGGDTFKANAAALINVKDVAVGGSDTILQLGTGALTVTLSADGAADTITATGTGALTVNAGAATGITTINLNATNGVADSITLNDGGGGVGLSLALNRLVISGFSKTNDTITLDVNQTTAGTAAGLNAVPQVENAKTTGSNLVFNTGLADVLLLNYDVAGSAAVLAGDLTGATLLANIVDAGKNLQVSANGDDGYIVAIDNGVAYLYVVNEGADGDTNVAAVDIALIGVINGINVGDLSSLNFVMGL